MFMVHGIHLPPYIPKANRISWLYSVFFEQKDILAFGGRCFQTGCPASVGVQGVHESVLQGNVQGRKWVTVGIDSPRVRDILIT